SAFYFDIRKDSIYCDRPDSLRRRAARTVLDHLHRCLATWLAPMLCFTAEEAWQARFGADSSVHRQQFPVIPAEWRDEALARRMVQIRVYRKFCTEAVEEQRVGGAIKSSLQAQVEVTVLEGDLSWMSEEPWAELTIVSKATFIRDQPIPSAVASLAPGRKCARCWRVLPEVGQQPGHPLLCARCADAVESGLVCEAAA
ncbi:MAG: class I tRNA ligase family protein, partial [Acetobacteraceae bacterium]|nr:class I tRNA ligase family protein [Acetobacteraceae bacterium]